MQKIYTILGMIIFWVAYSIICAYIIGFIFIRLKMLFNKYIGLDSIKYFFGKRYSSEYIREVYSYFTTKGIKTKGSRGKIFTYMLKYRLRNIRSVN